MSKLLKVAKYLVIFGVSIAVLVILASLFSEGNNPNQVQFGVSYSPRYARYLKLDWQKTYLSMLDELKVKNLRVPSYWNSLEPKEQEYDFSDTDFMLSEADKRGVAVILVLGIRQPRWPECHVPNWVKQLTVLERQQATLKFVEQVIKRYQANSSIWAYQLENEPFVSWFGENCDPPDKQFLQKEVELVKKLDTKRPIIITDSGEWGSWVNPIALSDILGISIYKKTFNSNLNFYFTYPFTPGMYNLKSTLIKTLVGDQGKKVIVTELQAEPWLSMRDSEEFSPQRQAQLFSTSDFKSYIEFVKRTNFDEAYLWGVEWWYWMAENGQREYLEYAKTLF